MKKNAIVVIGAGSIGQAIARRVSAGKQVITLLTVSFQAIKAAVANPAHSLRTE